MHTIAASTGREGAFYRTPRQELVTFIARTATGVRLRDARGNEHEVPGAFPLVEEPDAPTVQWVGAPLDELERGLAAGQVHPEQVEDLVMHDRRPEVATLLAKHLGSSAETGTADTSSTAPNGVSVPEPPLAGELYMRSTWVQGSGETLDLPEPALSLGPEILAAGTVNEQIRLIRCATPADLEGLDANPLIKGGARNAIASQRALFAKIEASTAAELDAMARDENTWARTAAISRVHHRLRELGLPIPEVEASSGSPRAFAERRTGRQITPQEAQLFADMVGTVRASRAALQATEDGALVHAAFDWERSHENRNTVRAQLGARMLALGIKVPEENPVQQQTIMQPPAGKGPDQIAEAVAAERRQWDGATGISPADMGRGGVPVVTPNEQRDPVSEPRPHDVWREKGLPLAHGAPTWNLVEVSGIDPATMNPSIVRRMWGGQIIIPGGTLPRFAFANIVRDMELVQKGRPDPETPGAWLPPEDGFNYSLGVHSVDGSGRTKPPPDELLPMGHGRVRLDVPNSDATPPVLPDVGSPSTNVEATLPPFEGGPLHDPGSRAARPLEDEPTPSSPLAVPEPKTMPPETRVDENVQGGAPTFGPGPVDTAMENGAQTVFDEADPGVVLARKPLAEQVAEVSIARAREIIEQLETQDELDTANTIEATIKNRSAVRSAIAKRAGVLAGKVPPEEEKPPEEKPKRVRRDGPAVPLEPDVRRSHPDTIITDDGPAADGPVGPFPEVARSTVHSAEDAREVFRKVFESIQPAPDLPERTLISRTMREVAEAVRDIGAAGQPLSVRRIRVRETVGTLVVETEIDVEIGGGK